MVTINQFRAQLEQGGHRSNRFRCQVTFPQRDSTLYPKAQKSFQFLAFASSIPAQGLDETVVKYLGRPVYLAGDPTEPELWSCTVYNALTFDIRNACISWKNNYMDPSSTNGNNMIDVASVEIFALDKDDNIIQQCTLENAWPKNVGAVEMSWNNASEISTFQLQIRYDYPVEIPVAQNTTPAIIQGA